MSAPMRVGTCRSKPVALAQELMAEQGGLKPPSPWSLLGFERHPAIQQIAVSAGMFPQSRSTVVWGAHKAKISVSQWVLAMIRGRWGGDCRQSGPS